MIFSIAVIITCFLSLLFASENACTIAFWVPLVGYFTASYSLIARIAKNTYKMPLAVGLPIIGLLGTLTANCIWLDARYLGRIAEYRFCAIEAAILMLFVILEMLPQKQTVTCDR